MSEPRVDVVCIGNAIVDVISEVPHEFIDEHDLVKGSMTLIETDRAELLYDAMPNRTQASGGSAANTSAGVASFGGSVAFIGRVARDELGVFYGDDLRQIGVEYDVAPTADGLPTARSMIFVTPDAERTMNTFLGASGELAPPDVDPEVAAAGRIVFCEGYLWDREEAKAAITKGMDAARRAGRKVAFTLSDPFCVERHRAEFLELADGPIDVLFANQNELLSLAETEDLDDAIGAIRPMVEVLAVTRSELGSIVVRGDDRYTLPAEPVAEVVDTTGAGDLYAAGFLYGWANGAAVDECARLGHVASAEVVSHLGPRPEIRLGDLI